MASFLFTDGRDLIGVQKPHDIKHMKMFRWATKVLSAWPRKSVGEKETRYPLLGKCYTFFIEIVCLPPGLLYIKNNLGTISFLELGRTYITVFMNIVAMCRLILIFMKRYDELVGDFVNKIHLFHHKDKSEYAMKTHILVHKFCHFFSVYLCIIMVLGISLFTGTPLYNNITSGAFANYKFGNVTFEHSVYYELPFDYEHEIKGYVFLFLFNWYITFICSSCFGAFDLLMSLMVFHVCGHLLILIERFENFRRPMPRIVSGEIYEWFSEEETVQVASDIKEIVEHHNLIIEFTSRMADLFGPVLILYYIFHMVSGCVLLLECSKMDTEALIRYGTLTFIMLQQLLQVSMVFELLGITSNKLVTAVYDVPWECMNVSNRKSVHMILVQSQRLMTIRALNMVNVGMQTMISRRLCISDVISWHWWTIVQWVKIVKSSISYFIMLRTVADMD